MEEIVEVPSRKSGNGTHQSNWLQATLSGVDEKMKAILNLLEDNHSPLQNAEIHEKSKETVKKMVKDLCLSYYSLAEKYQRLRSVPQDALSSRSSSPSKGKELSGSWDGNWDASQLEAINSNPESTVEDADIEYDKGGIKPENAWLEEKFKMLKLVEENTKLQVELIKRNTEKRETIRKLQNRVSRLVSENNALQHRLGYYDHNKQPVEVSSPRRKTILIDKFLRGCS